MPLDGGLRVDVLVEAPPAQVFPYLSDPALLVRWMGKTLHGDIEAGATYRLDFFGDGRAVVGGEFTEITAPSRVVFTWGWEEGDEVEPGGSTVTVEVTEVPLGTVVSLTHTGLPDASIEPHLEGWEQHLGRLAIAGAGGDPGPYGGGEG